MRLRLQYFQSLKLVAINLSIAFYFRFGAIRFRIAIRDSRHGNFDLANDLNYILHSRSRFLNTVILRKVLKADAKL